MTFVFREAYIRHTCSLIFGILAAGNFGFVKGAIDCENPFCNLGFQFRRPAEGKITCALLLAAYIIIVIVKNKNK